MTTQVKKWKCHTCGEEFNPSPPNYDCPKCKGKATSPIKLPEPKPSFIVPKKQAFTQVCHFQLEPKSKEQEFGRCALTGLATTPVGLGIVNVERIYYGPCDPEKCPMYQTWQIMKDYK